MNGMIDISDKRRTKRIAKAEVLVKLKEEIVKRIKEGKIEKGDVFEQARIAGIMAAKRTDEIIPLSHPLKLEHIGISFELKQEGLKITSVVSALEKTGVEMEALLSCAIAALTVYDMCKMYTKEIEISGLLLVEKKGGKSGIYKRRGGNLDG